jgi:hypothetical protein
LFRQRLQFFEIQLTFFCRYRDRLLLELQSYAENMSDVLSIFQKARETEQENAANLAWLPRQLRSARGPSHAVLASLPELNDRGIIEIVELALGRPFPAHSQHKANLNFLESHDASSVEGRQKKPPVPLASSQTASLATKKSHENPQKISDRAVPSSPKRVERHLNRTTGKKFEKSNFELEEVVIDGTAGVGTQQLAQLRSVVHHGCDDGRAAVGLNSNSSDSGHVAKPVKTIGALAPEPRGKGVARSLKAIITRRPNEFAGVRSQQEASSASAHVECGQSSAEPDCVVAKTSAAHPLPRSRSGSRIRSSGAADATSGDHSAGHVILTAAARKKEHASAASPSRDSPAPVTPSTTAPSTTPRLPPRSRSQSRNAVPDTGFPKRDVIQHHSSAETLDVAPDAVAAQRKGLGSAASSVALFNLPQAPPRSRSKSRGRATEQTKNDSPPPISIVQRLRMAGAQFEEC